MARRKVQENHLGDMAARAEMDHEVQMARSDLYKIAKYAVELHDMLKNVSEVEGIQGWQQSKITKAADYLGSVYHSMDYDTNVEMNESEDLDENRLKAIGNLVGGAASTVGRLLRGAKNIKLSDMQSELKKFLAASQGGVAELRRARAQSKLYRTATDASNAAANLQKAMNKYPQAFDKVYKKYGITEDQLTKIIQDVISPRNVTSTSGMGRETADMISADKKAIAKMLASIKTDLDGDEDVRMALRAITMAVIAGFFVAGELLDNDEQVDEDDVEEGNAYAHAVRKAKMDGKKKGDVINGPDGDITLSEHNAPKWAAFLGPKIATMIMGHPDMRKLASPYYKHPGDEKQGYRTSPDERAMPEPELDNPIIRILSKLLANGDITHDEYVQSVDSLEDYTGDYEDFEWAGHPGRMPIGHPDAVHEGKKKAKPDYLDFDGDGNKKEPMKKALKDKKKSANESMLRTITQAINYKAGKIGAANVTPKAMNLAETMITTDLKRLQADFKKKVIAEETAVDRGNAYFKLTGQDPQQSKLSDGQKLDLHKRAEALIKQYGLGGVPQPEIEKLQQSAGIVGEAKIPKKCWPGHKKVGTKPGTGRNKGKRVNKCKKI